jgi:hypothetical protein
VSDQTPPDESSSTGATDEGSDALSARLASMAAPRPGVASIWQRREASPATSPTIESSVASPRHVAGTGIGRLTRVTAAELWTDSSEMAGWIAANPEALAEVVGLEGIRFNTPNHGSVTGTTADGRAVCVVCEVGPSSDEGLGTLLRTAAVQDGGTVVWINGGPTDSHIAPVSWLNSATPPRFFLVKATGVRIDESASAPLFGVLVRPARSGEPHEGSADVPQRRVEDHLPAE